MLLRSQQLLLPFVFLLLVGYISAISPDLERASKMLGPFVVRLRGSVQIVSRSAGARPVGWVGLGPAWMGAMGWVSGPSVATVISAP